MTKKAVIVAHRGSSSEAMENTSPAFNLALRQGAKFLECDVRETKDSKIVVIHDAKINRITSAKGLVSRYTLKELGDFGVPSLKEVLLLIKKKGATLLIEIKEEGIEKKILKDIEKTKTEERVRVISFSKKQLVRVKSLERKIKTGLIFHETREDIIKSALDIHADLVMPNFRNIDESFLKKAHKNKLKVFAWTADSIKESRKLVKMGVDGVVTNRFRIINRALKKP